MQKLYRDKCIFGKHYVFEKTALTEISNNETAFLSNTQNILKNLNQTPEQLARDKIDAMLIASGWIIQSKNEINLAAGLGVAVREYQTDVGPADYVLFVDRKPVGVIEAKRALS